MANTELEQRTLRFSHRIVALGHQMARDHVGITVRKQLTRCGTSIGANYREAQWAESRKDFQHKIEIATKEAAETLYWLELIQGSDVLRTKNSAELLDEARQLLAIFAAIGRKLRQTESHRKAAERGNAEGGRPGKE